MKGTSFFCPYCLQQDAGPVIMQESRRQYYACNICNARIPPEYYSDSQLKEVVALVGLHGHGKSMYLNSLFHTINHLANIWEGFYSFAVDERSLDTVRDNVRMLKAGESPPATPVQPPVPILMELKNMPLWCSRLLVFYDLGGDAFSRADNVVRYAGFVRWARTTFIMLSLSELEDFTRIHDLLSTYVQGVLELGGIPEQQNLVVVLSKADRIRNNLSRNPDLWEYLINGTAETLTEDMPAYFNRMHEISNLLADLLEAQGAHQFLNFSRDRFQTVRFSLVSALGAETQGSIEIELIPKRVMDPLLWLLYNSHIYQEIISREENHEWLQIFHRRSRKIQERNAGNMYQNPKFQFTSHPAHGQA